MSEKAAALIRQITQAVAAGRSDEIGAVLADSVTLNTPRFLKPITDRAHVMIVLKTIPKVLDGFGYERTWAAGDEAIMEFKGKIGEVLVHGLDIFHLDAEGKVDELTVFVRPTKALQALAETEDALVIAELRRMQADAAEQA